MDNKNKIIRLLLKKIEKIQNILSIKNDMRFRQKNNIIDQLNN